MSSSKLAKRSGFGVILVIFIAVIILAVVGFVVLQNQNSSVPTPQNTPSSPPSTITPAVPSPEPSSTASPAPTSNLSVYKNQKYGFEISYPKSYRVLEDADSLSGYPNGVVLLYTGGQAYDIVVEVWNTKAEYESEYEFRLADITVIRSGDKFITLLNNNPTAANKEIIDSFKLL